VSSVKHSNAVAAACQDIQDKEAFPVEVANQVPLANQAVQVARVVHRSCARKSKSRHVDHVRQAHPDHQAPMVMLAIQEGPDRPEDPEIQDLPEIPAHRDHQDHQDHQVAMALGATADDQPFQHQIFQENQASQENPAPMDNQVNLVHPAAMDFPETPDPQDHQDPLASLAKMAMQVPKAQPDPQVLQEKRVFVPNTARWMVVSSSKMALGVNQPTTTSTPILPKNCPTTVYTYILPFFFVIITHNTKKPRAHASNFVLQ